MSNKEHVGTQAGADAGGIDRRAEAPWEMRVLESPNRELYLRLRTTLRSIDIKAALGALNAKPVTGRTYTEHPIETHELLLEPSLQLVQATFGSIFKGVIEEMTVTNAPVEKIGGFLEQWKNEDEKIALWRAALMERRGAESIVIPQTQLSFSWVKQATTTDEKEHFRPEVEKLTAELASARQEQKAAQAKISTLTEENHQLGDEVEKVKAELSAERQGKAAALVTLGLMTEEKQRVRKEWATVMATLNSERQSRLQLVRAMMKLIEDETAAQQKALNNEVETRTP